MRRRNIFPDPECAGMMHPYTNDGTRSDFVGNEGMMWMRATVTAVGTQQNYAQYSLNEDRVPVEGAYHVRLLAHAEGGDGMARCYVRQPNSTYLPCYAVNIPDGQTIVVERAIKVPAGCGELIVRICPAAVVGATAMMSRINIEAADTYEIASGGGASGLLHRADRAVLTLRRVTADETRESKRVGDQAPRQWFRGADGRTDLYRHGGRSAAFASMGQYFARRSDDRHVFRDSHGHVIRRYPDEREESDHRGWRGHHARNKRMVVGRHIARQGRARDHTVHRMVQRRGLAYHASFARRLLLQGHGSILALGLGVVA